MRIVLSFLLALICCTTFADTVVLKDGSRIDGDIKRGDGGYDVTDADGKTTHVAFTDVQSIQLGKAGGGMSAMDKFNSMKRSVESLDDLNKIVGRYTDFIAQNKGTPAAALAEKELAAWQERLDQHMVKVAGKWVTPEQQDQMIAQSGEIVKQAYELMKANRLKEAEPVLKQALAIDSTNPVANYLEGVLLFRSDKIVPARKSFEAAHAQLPSDAATLNNLAVCAWRQNQPVVSLGFYCDAMLAMPQNKEIVNNVAEALAALKDDFKKTPNAQRASRLFVEQEAALETTMAKYGWYRWGSTWLDQAQLAELKKAEKDLKDKMDQLQKDFDGANQKMAENNDRMQKDQDLMNDLRNSQYDSMGHQITNVLPGAYYDADREITRLTEENRTLQENVDKYRVEAKRLEGMKPKPKYTGVQNLIGVEGTPKMESAATDPTPAPAPGTPSPAPSTQPAPGKPTTSSVF